MLHIALELNYINEDLYKKFKNECIEISRLLSGLIKTL